MTQVQLARSTGTPYTPPSVVRRGSILDHAHIVEGVRFNDPAGLVWSFNCIGVDVDEVTCATTTALTKRFDSPSSIDGALFVIQEGMTCKPFGFDMNDPAIKKAFEAVEPQGVSLGLYKSVFDTAVDITPGATSLPPVVALGLAEGKGFTDYAGQAIIHLGPGIVSQLASQNAIEVSDGKLTTALGTPIAVSGGYESKTAGKLDQDQWIYVTGAVVLARSEPVLQAELNRSTNDMVVLYERLYVAGVDCLNAKVKVKVY